SVDIAGKFLGRSRERAVERGVALETTVLCRHCQFRRNHACQQRSHRTYPHRTYPSAENVAKYETSRTPAPVTQRTLAAPSRVTAQTGTAPPHPPTRPTPRMPTSSPSKQKT